MRAFRNIKQVSEAVLCAFLADYQRLAADGEKSMRDVQFVQTELAKLRLKVAQELGDTEKEINWLRANAENNKEADEYAGKRIRELETERDEAVKDAIEHDDTSINIETKMLKACQENFYAGWHEALTEVERAIKYVDSLETYNKFCKLRNRHPFPERINNENAK
jgi:hypothetical protein